MKIIEEIIRQSRTYDRSIEDILNSLNETFEELTNTSYPLSDYFGRGMGYANSKNNLIRDNVISNEWLTINHDRKKPQEDIKGLYVFSDDNNRPFYYGISRRVIERIQSHLKGKSHLTSSMVYKLSRLVDEEKGIRDNTTRKGYDFIGKSEPIKSWLLKQSFNLIPISSNEEMVIAEVYCSMRSQTFLNEFGTH
jgi:predicted GIY-YIG superfamily endonuclease